MGDAVNLASRLEDVSERGQILVGPDTYRLTAPLFEFETLEPVKVKGKAEPVPVYRLVGAKAGARSRARAGDARALVRRWWGVTPEFAAINGCLERLVGGPGRHRRHHRRSRAGQIAADGRNAAAGRSDCGMRIRTWLEGRTLSFGQTISYWPFQEILRAVRGHHRRRQRSGAWHKLESRVGGIVRRAHGGDSALPGQPAHA